MARWIVAAVILLGGVLQLYAAISTARREGPLRTQQARQLESAVGRRGVVAVFGFLGVSLLVAGLALALLGSD